MIKKIAFTAYPVIDMKRARQFYETVLGLETDLEFNDHWVEYDLPGGGCLGLTTIMTGVVPSATAGGSIAFEVENLEKFVTELKSKEVKFTLEITETPVCHMAVAIDSEGNSFILHQVKPKK